MNEKDTIPRVKELLASPEAAPLLGVTAADPRWVKIPDAPYSKMRDGKGFAPFKGTDLVLVYDCCEIKKVKARTAQGMIFRPGVQLRPRQDEHLVEHDGLLAIAFIAAGKPDRLAAIALARWKALRDEINKIDARHWEEKTVSLFELERLSKERSLDHLVKRYMGYARIAR